MSEMKVLINTILETMAGQIGVVPAVLTFCIVISLAVSCIVVMLLTLLGPLLPSLRTTRTERKAMGRGYRPKLSSLESVVKAIRMRWPEDPMKVPDTPDNRRLLRDGLYWADVELMRHNYDPVWLTFFKTTLSCLERSWSVGA